MYKETNRKIVLGVLVFQLVTSLSLPIQAQGNSRTRLDRKCNRAIDSVGVNMKRGRKLNITEVGPYDITKHYKNYPRNRTFGVYFGLSGKSAEAFVYSPKTSISLSKSIINSCPTVGVVKFFKTNTDSYGTFGLVKGRVQAFKCQEAGRVRGTPDWGYEDCSTP